MVLDATSTAWLALPRTRVADGSIKLIFGCVPAAVTVMEVAPEPELSPERVIVWFPVNAPKLAAVTSPCKVTLDGLSVKK